MPLYMLEEQLVLFIHVPKAGGSSIENFLSPHYVAMLDRTGGGGLPCSPQHFHGEILSSVLRDAPLAYAFMVVRHPLARLLSEYRFRRKTGYGPALDMNFSAWVADTFRRQGGNPYYLDNHIRPMHEFLMPGIEVFRMEDGLEGAVQALAAHFPNAIAQEARIPRNNASNRHDALAGEAGLDPDTRALIERFYARDIQLWYADER